MGPRRRRQLTVELDRTPDAATGGPGRDGPDLDQRRYAVEGSIGLDQPETGAKVESGAEPGGGRIVHVDGRRLQDGIEVIGAE